jgi:hypothetical protein
LRRLPVPIAPTGTVPGTQRRPGLLRVRILRQPVTGMAEVSVHGTKSFCLFCARALKSAGRVGCLNQKQGNLPLTRPARPGQGHRPGPALRVPHARPAHDGRWPFLARGATAPVASIRAGGGNAARFLFPPGGTKALSPLQWQGPSPLPQRHFGIRTSRGPKPPTRPRRALCTHRVGRWPSAVPGPAGL